MHIPLSWTESSVRLQDFVLRASRSGTILCNLSPLKPDLWVLLNRPRELKLQYELEVPVKYSSRFCYSQTVMLEGFSHNFSNNKRALRDPFSFEIVRGYLVLFWDSLFFLCFRTRFGICDWQPIIHIVFLSQFNQTVDGEWVTSRRPVKESPGWWDPDTRTL